MPTQISHLFEHPHHLPAVAQMIYREFWVDVTDGMSVADLEAHLQTATDPTRIPLSLVVLAGERLVGTINLIENDDSKRAHLRPWLAALVVAEDVRGQGLGSRLVNALLDEARRMGISVVYFGTDGPGFYERLGALRHERVTDAFFIMRFEL